MKKKLYQDELEGFLSESAEDLRMYPSARVWRNIDTKIHGEKKWPALTFAAFLTGALTLAGLIFMQPDKDLFKPKNQAAAASKTEQIIADPAEAFAVTQNPFDLAARKSTAPKNNADESLGKTVNVDVQMMEGTELQAESNELSAEIASAASLNANIALLNNSESAVANAAQDGWPENRIQNGISIDEKDLLFNNTNTDETQMQQGVIPTNATASITPLKLNIEEAEASAPPLSTPAKKSKWSVQYYATPSLSYRMLSEQKELDYLSLSTGNVPANYYNSLGAMVNHKPRLGVEAGVAFMYDITDNFRVKAGLQMNYRQYAIDAYNSGMQQAAIIRIDQGTTNDTIFATTRISNVGIQEDAVQVTNHFFQIGVPVGFELSMVNSKRAQFVLAATFQPTYNIGQQAWLISTDYQSYVKQPDLMRTFNFNTGVEAFLRFSSKSGNMNWQVGPQIRYQMLPGAMNTYPVREHLIDYGLKIGVSKTLK